jgi:hypothetical protein
MDLETQPSPVRLLPPRVPPAPPGTGSAPRPSGGPPDPSGTLMTGLEVCRDDLGAVRTAFETMECFPDDEALRVELVSTIAEVRTSLIRRLEELRDLIRPGEVSFEVVDLEAFKKRLLALATQGVRRSLLDEAMKIDLFGSVAVRESDQVDTLPQPSYRYEFLPQHDLVLMECLTPWAFTQRVFDDLLDAAREESSYESKLLCDRNVFQKVVAVTCAFYATTDPAIVTMSGFD